MIQFDGEATYVIGLGVDRVILLRRSVIADMVRIRGGNGCSGRTLMVLIYCREEEDP